jgi:hypothetical protein
MKLLRYSVAGMTGLLIAMSLWLAFQGAWEAIIGWFLASGGLAFVGVLDGR